MLRKEKMIDSKAIERDFIHLLECQIGTEFNKKTLNKIGKDAAEIMFKHGFSGDYSTNLPLVIPGINLRAEYDLETSQFVLAFKPNIDENWIEVQANPCIT
jgi:hypothetical protein